MNSHIDLERFKLSLALDEWVIDSRQRVMKRYPSLIFDAQKWSFTVEKEVGTKEISFTKLVEDFYNKDENFVKAARCYMAELVLNVEAKDYGHFLTQFRLLKLAGVDSLFDLNANSLRIIEKTLVNEAELKPSASTKNLNFLQALTRIIDVLSNRQVINRLRYRTENETRSKLLSINKTHIKNWRKAKEEVLSHSIEALSEAFNALFANDPRLSVGDRVAIATLGLEMCAPSRINEILCLSIDDYVTLDDYARKVENKTTDFLHASHQLLLVTTKGSKGAQWNAKPVLNFMIELFHYCMKIIREHGERSRLLINWYGHNPQSLYLPSELEYLRGKDLTVRDISMILALSNSAENTSLGTAEQLIGRELKSVRFSVLKPNKLTSKFYPNTHVYAVHWKDLEQLLLVKVHKAIKDCRKVTTKNLYSGELGKMLFLFDGGNNPYLPSSVTYSVINRRLKNNEYLYQRNYNFEPSLFEKLKIMMPVNGVTQFAEIDSHDPRRWLTTMALKNGEKLSNVLINKWARRLDISQLWNYDFRSYEEKATSSAMPEPAELRELSDGLISCNKIEDEYGPKIDLVTVHDAGISGTTMDAINSASGSRPVAKTGEQIIIIYPTWYGFCTHQHHEKPCRAYTSCLPCDNNHIVKGHLPTNDRIRSRADELHSSILNIIEQLFVIHGRGIADFQDLLGEHINQLVERGLTPDQMTADLINRFHDIKHLIKDAVLRNQIHEAFVVTGYREKLDLPDISNGALIKYHNPTHHSAPGLERALDAYGGHEKIESDRLALIREYPQFAPTSKGIESKVPMDISEGIYIESEDDLYD